MKVDLSEEDLAHIEQWYYAASGESVTERSAEMFALLDKLGIKAAEHDLYPPNPDHCCESRKPMAMAQVAAIEAYLERHPEIKY